MRILPAIVCAILLCPILLRSATGQLRLSPEAASKAAAVFDDPAPNSLKCWVERWDPALDFAFRFIGGYLAHCRVGQFEGKRTTLGSYLRVTPEGGQPATFGFAHIVPELPPDMSWAAGNLAKLENEIELSGAVGLGEGRYFVELLITDGQTRSFRKHWKLRVSRNHSQQGVALAINPRTVESVDERSWQTVSSSRDGTLRLTILLDAAPMNWYQSNLRAWDRAFLIESVYSLVRQTPHKTLHLVAFNLDQQRELFRSDQFDSAAFQALSRALDQVELSSVSVNVLKKRDSPEFLLALANQELAADRSDVIIFAGPNTRIDTEMTAGALSGKQKDGPAIFYFEYFPWEGSLFPDSIDWLVRAAGGRVFQIHTPSELDHSIDKMLVQLKQK